MNAYSSDEIKIKLSATNQSGVLTALHIIASKFGLKVTDNMISRVSKDRSRVVVVFEGNLNATQTELTDAMEAHSKIYSIDDIEVKSHSKTYTNDDIEIKSQSFVIADDVIEFKPQSTLYSHDEDEDDDEYEPQSTLYSDDDVEYESESPSNVYSEDDIEFETEFESDSNVDSEDDIELESSYESNTFFEENSSLKESPEVSYKFNANDIITEESLETAEEILLDLLGPIGPLLITSASIEATTIGELYLLLSEEMGGKTKANFLALVKGLS